MADAPPIHVLLTVPHMSVTATPYPEMVAIAKYLPGDRIRLQVCSLTESGFRETKPMLDALDVPSFVARFRPGRHRPRRRMLAQAWQSLHEQTRVNARGPHDIQHSLDYTASPFEALMARWQRRPYVYTQRNLNEGGSTTLLRAKVRLADRVFAISNCTRDLLLSVGAPLDQIRTIPNGIDLEAIGPPTPIAQRPGNLLISVGHVQRRKRHDDAIRLVASLAPRRPDLRLQIVGNTYDTAHQQELRELARSLGVADRVEFLGVRTDVINLMRAADVLVLCSESEAFGVVLLEAMAVGLPIVASDVDGPREILESGRTGLLVTPRDVKSFGAAVERLLDDRPEAARIADAARATVERKFSARVMVEAYAEAYEEIADRVRRN